jgi:3-hydroxyisobutyrate dehydrogenase
VLTMLSDADAVVTAMESPEGALPVMAESGQPDHPIWLQMSTIGEEATDWCAGLAGRYGAGFVDAPVLGTREPAEKGELVVLASGPEKARPRVQPVFDAIGHRTIEGGPLDLPYLRTKAQAMADRDFRPSFRLKLAAKDAGLVTDAAWQHGLSLPVLEAIARRFSQAATEHGDHDISATYLASLPERAA